MAGDYYVWSVEDKPVRVHISLSLVERLGSQAIDAFRVSPERPRETGGVLLGRVMQDGRTRVIFADDFEPLETLPVRLAPIRDLTPVGMYRGRAGDDLRLDAEDAEVVGKLFKSADLVYLLVLPQAGAPPRAAIFIQERGRINGYSPYREFPFHAQLLADGAFASSDGRAAKGRKASSFPALAGVALAAAMLIPVAMNREQLLSAVTQSAPADEEVTPIAPSEPAPGPAAAETKPPPLPARATPGGSESEASRMATPPNLPVATPSTSAGMERRPSLHRTASATYSLDPVRPNRLQRWVQKVPGLRAIQNRRYRDGDRFVPARQLRQTAPVVPGAIAERLNREVPIQLRLHVDKRGRVSEVDVVNDGAGHSELTELAASTAERWSFKPARLNDQPVESDVMARFRFRPLQ